MKTILEQMIQNYKTENVMEQKNAVKEVMQELVLCGLSRAGFFDKAAFYGGTALRIFYGLDRFSEDLDFSLITEDTEFNLSEYFPMLEKEVRSFGLDVKIDMKEKTKKSNVSSAFLKGNTKEHLMYFFPEGVDFSSVPKNEIIKIKFEVDVKPPLYATFERKYRMQPIPYEVCLYDMPSLFAGKLHAVIGRAWKNRIKGRDLYDYIFYLSRKTPVNRKHLIARLVQSGHLQAGVDYSLGEIKSMLKNRFDNIDYEQAKDDVAPFIKDKSVLAVWSAEFFKQITETLTENIDIKEKKN